MIWRGDDTNSFKQNWLEIQVDIPSTWLVSYAEFKVGNLPSIPILPEEGETYVTFPQTINLSSSQTALLKDINTCYLAIYDNEGLKQTLEGSFTFKANKRVV